MIGRLRGALLESDDEELLVEVSGVGYNVRCGVRTLAALPEAGAEIILHIESQTREDGTRLYGFLSKDERQAFRKLLDVQGVGPKAALSVLDILTPEDLTIAVANEDKTRVGKANGVGPKLAQRIVIELKGKALTTGGVFVPPVGMASAPATAASAPVSVNGESVAALMGLGISETQSRVAVENALRELGPEAELAAVIRASLKVLGR